MVLNVKTRSILIDVIVVIALVYCFWGVLRRTTFEHDLLTHAFSRQAGVDESLPANVVEARALLLKNKINAFSIDADLTKDFQFYQRILESMYPSRESDLAPVVVAANGNAKYSACKLLDSSAHIALYVCNHGTN
ncbi:hypothetical protein [Paraburkholderia sp. JHI869]|uniref:hypothetical protein n=1 Tax=Paraburkholderia sp. JHI869 TaxID=3112959 RepID=UPI00317BAFB1